ncbi:unnamed protein product [Effrenium voratum]|nr:unnamed protein product [Effrenium voratum]
MDDAEAAPRRRSFQRGPAAQRLLAESESPRSKTADASQIASASQSTEPPRAASSAQDRCVQLEAELERALRANELLRLSNEQLYAVCEEFMRSMGVELKASSEGNKRDERILAQATQAAAALQTAQAAQLPGATSNGVTELSEKAASDDQLPSALERGRAAGEQATATASVPKLDAQPQGPRPLEENFFEKLGIEPTPLSSDDEDFQLPKKWQRRLLDDLMLEPRYAQAATLIDLLVGGCDANEDAFAERTTA